MELSLSPGDDQGPPTVVARLEGADAPSRRVELALEDGRYRIVRSEGGPLLVSATVPPGVGGTLNGTSLTNVAPAVGLSFRHGAFRFGMSNDTTAMMGGGLCWLDYDEDGWLDLFVVNSYADTDIRRVGRARRPTADGTLPERQRDVRRRQPRLGCRVCRCEETDALRPTSTSTATPTST